MTKTPLVMVFTSGVFKLTCMCFYLSLGAGCLQTTLM